MATSTFYATNSGRWHNGSGNMQPTNYAYGWISGNDPCTGRFYAYPDYLGNYGNRYGLIWFNTAAISTAMENQNISGVTLTLRRTDTGGRNPSGAVMGTADKYLYVWGLKLAAAGKGSTAIGNTYGVSKSYVSTVGAKYATYNSPIYRNSTITVTIPAALFTAWLADGITGLMVCDGDDSNVTQGDANHVYGDGMNGRVDNPPPYVDTGSTYGYMTFAGYDNATYKPYLTITHTPSVPNPTPPPWITNPGTITAATNKFDWGDASDTIFPSNQLSYEMQVSYNGGTSWSGTYTSAQGSSQYSLNIKTALGLAAAQYYYNTNCKFRVRTKTPLYNGQHYYSSWVTSGVFKIDYRIAPSAPTLSVSKTEPYEGEQVTFTIGRPTTYNTLYSDGGAMGVRYYIMHRHGATLTTKDTTFAVDPVSVAYTVPNLTDGADMTGYYAYVYAVDEGGQKSPNSEPPYPVFNIKRFRVPAVTAIIGERQEEQCTVAVTVMDTGYGGVQSGSQINKVEYRLDDGAWTQATLLGWSGLHNTFNITGLDENTQYDLSVRAVNNAPDGTALSSKTSPTYSLKILEYTPATHTWHDSAATGTQADQGFSAKSLIVGADFNLPVDKGEARIRAIEDGWVKAHETWTYASTTTITVPSGATSRYQKGDKIKLTQTTVKYFYIVGVADTTLTITGGSDYTLANAAITDNQYSKAENPQGFPDWFNWTPAFTGFASAPAGGVYRFRIDGRQCVCVIRQPSAGISNAATYTISAPVRSAGIAGMTWGACAPVADNGVRQSVPGQIEIGADSQIVHVGRNAALEPWTASGGKRVVFATLVYEY